MAHTELCQFVKQRRKQTGLTQEDLAYKAGVGLRFVRDLEQGKQALRLDKVNQVLQLFNYQVGPIPTPPVSDKTPPGHES
ncbi:MAG: helix-turn-helix transcriptional regulator [Rudanella sp.]|nr:helix-turn-helix transcriptional regulator [Rudanella sp.]